MPVLGRPSSEESYPSLANQSSARAKQGEVKRGRGSAPSRKISLRFVTGLEFTVVLGYTTCLLSGLWSQGLLLSLSHGGLQLLKPGWAVPNRNVDSDQ